MRQEGSGVKGRLEVIAGCMFSGKTTHLFLTVERDILRGRRVQVLRIAPGGPFGTQILRAKSGLARSAIFVRDLEDLRRSIKSLVDVVAIDDVHFLPEGFIQLVEELIDHGVNVIVTGLDLDFRGRPFGIMPILISMADSVVKRDAVCMACYGVATRTQRFYGDRPASVDDDLIVHGAAERYEPRCRNCHVVSYEPPSPDKSLPQQKP